jgi:hypothetical protein
MTTSRPRIIGLVGNPKAGKSTAQKILEKYVYWPIDDGAVLRRFCIENLGLTHDDVYTQEGKARCTEILGKTWQNRDLLGTLGQQLEDMLGEHIMPFIALKQLNPREKYSFGSVRKTQGHFIRQQGGIVIEIINPDAGPSPFAFDQYDRTAIDFSINNDALARGLSEQEALADLEGKLRRIILR